MVKPLKQIFLLNENTENSYVNYENQLKPRIQFYLDTTSTTKSKLQKMYYLYEEKILNIVTKEIAEYLSDENVCNNEEGMFPQWKRLTGEWYIGNISVEERKGDIWVSVEIRFLENFIMSDKREQLMDYLALEVHSFYEKEADKFVFSGIDSSSV